MFVGFVSSGKGALELAVNCVLLYIRKLSLLIFNLIFVTVLFVFNYSSHTILNLGSRIL